MPEGDTIYRAAGQLCQALHGRRVKAFRTQVPQIRSLFPDRLVGQDVTDVESRGKHLLIWFAPSELCLRVVSANPSPEPHGRCCGFANST